MSVWQGNSPIEVTGFCLSSLLYLSHTVCLAHTEEALTEHCELNQWINAFATPLKNIGHIPICMSVYLFHKPVPSHHWIPRAWHSTWHRSGAAVEGELTAGTVSQSNIRNVTRVGTSVKEVRHQPRVYHLRRHQKTQKSRCIIFQCNILNNEGRTEMKVRQWGVSSGEKPDLILV